MDFCSVFLTSVSSCDHCTVWAQSHPIPTEMLPSAGRPPPRRGTGFLRQPRHVPLSVVFLRGHVTAVLVCLRVGCLNAVHSVTLIDPRCFCVQLVSPSPHALRGAPLGCRSAPAQRARRSVQWRACGGRLPGSAPPPFVLELSPMFPLCFFGLISFCRSDWRLPTVRSSASLSFLHPRAPWSPLHFRNVALLPPGPRGSCENPAAGQPASPFGRRPVLLAALKAIVRTFQKLN